MKTTVKKRRSQQAQVKSWRVLAPFKCADVDFSVCKFKQWSLLDAGPYKCIVFATNITSNLNRYLKVELSERHGKYQCSQQTHARTMKTHTYSKLLLMQSMNPGCFRCMNDRDKEGLGVLEIA